MCPSVRKSLVFSAFIVALSSIATAQETISTDRPGFTFTPWLVPTGRFQAELGIPSAVITEGSGGDSKAWNLPLQLRYGLSSALELRLGSPMYTAVSDDVTDTTTEGWGDVEVGAKAALSDAAGWLPKSALIAGVRLPVGDDDFTSHQAGYNLNCVADWDLGGGNLFRGMAGVSRTPSGSDDALTGTFVALLGRAFSSQCSGYVELTALPGFNDVAVDQNYAGAGIAYLVNNDLQLDLSGDFGLDADSADAILALGVSWRR